MISFGPYSTGETVDLSFDFLSKLALGETLTGTPTRSIAVWSGVSANPSTVLSGSPTISGSKVIQRIIAADPGTIFQLDVKCSTSAGQSLMLSGLITTLDARV